MNNQQYYPFEEDEINCLLKTKDIIEDRINSSKTIIDFSKVEKAFIIGPFIKTIIMESVNPLKFAREKIYGLDPINKINCLRLNMIYTGTIRRGPYGMFLEKPRSLNNPKKQLDSYFDVFKADVFQNWSLFSTTNYLKRLESLDEPYYTFGGGLFISKAQFELIKKGITKCYE